MRFEGLDRDVTFFATSEVSRQAIEYLAETLRTEGFEVTITDNRFREAEIGIYPSPARVPYVDAELSIAMFHGIDASFAERYWPHHDWSQFDVGFLPSRAAAETWQRTSDVLHARPELGMFVTGWPKSDYVFTEAFDDDVREYRDQYGIGDGRTVMYAPLAESRGKIHDFVDHARDVADNLLVKHGPLDGGYALPDGMTLDEVYEAYHDDEDVYILDENDSIYYGLAVADVLVSEMSSPLTDAAVTDTVPVSVLNWPQRNDLLAGPKDELPEFAVRTRSWELTETLEAIYDDYDRYVDEMLDQRPHYYYALGESSDLIAEFIERLIAGELPPVEPVTRTKFSRRKDAYYRTTMTAERTFFRLKWAIVTSLSENQKRLLKKYGADKLLDLYERLFTLR